MKKKVLLLAAMTICTAILASGTLAYFTDETRAHNTITTNKVDIEIEEWQQTANGLVPYPNEKIAIMPTEEVSKIVQVKNNDATSFIRAKLDVVVMNSQNVQMDIPSEELKEVIILNMNTKDWTEQDGWWYYNEPVKNGEVTEALMTAVEFDGPNMTNEYQNCTVEIDVNAQAVQVANNGSSALDAAGWPKEEN